MKDAYLVPGEQIPERYRRLYAEINLDAVRENLGRMKENLAPDTSIIAVVKADAYGHGAEVVARELEEASYVSGFAVATFEEAVSLRRAGIVKPVLVLGYVFPCCYGEAIRQACPFSGRYPKGAPKGSRAFKSQRNFKKAKGTY